MERYKEYKQSSVGWIGEIPHEWDVIRTKHCFQIKKRIVGYEGPTVLSVTQNGIVAKDTVSGEGQLAANYSGYQWVYPGDFAMNHMDLLTGWVDCSSVQGVTSPDYRVFVAISDKIDRSYYTFVFQHCYTARVYYSLGQGVSGLGRWRLPADQFNNFLLPLPPLDEQKLIADYLDAKTAEIDALVADCEREVELLQEYRKAVISEAVTKGLDPDAPMKDSSIEWIGEIPVGWEVVGFKTYLTGIIDYRGRTPEKVDEGVFLITGRNIKQGRVHYELSQEYMRPEDFDAIMSRGKLQIGNVLFTMEAPLGEVALIDRDDCAAAQRIVQLCCNKDELYGAFLVYWIMSDAFQSNLHTYATGSTASGIKASKLGMLRLIHPPLKTQRNIVDYLNAVTAKIDSLINDKQSMADKLREYRRSLISEAVTGKFKVPGI